MEIFDDGCMAMPLPILMIIKRMSWFPGTLISDQLENLNLISSFYHHHNHISIPMVSGDQMDFFMSCISES